MSRAAHIKADTLSDCEVEICRALNWELATAVGWRRTEVLDSDGAEDTM
jgi:hypothetical protein